jgi:hypothetical protein
MAVRDEVWTEARLQLMQSMAGKGPNAMWEALNELPGAKLTKSAVNGKRDRMFGPDRPTKTDAEKEGSAAARRERDILRKREVRASRAMRSKELGAGSVGSAAAGVIQRIQAKANRSPDIEFKAAPEPEGIQPKNIGLADLNTFTCHAIYGEGLLATYCGHMTTLCGPQKERQSPYCREHHSLYYKPVPAKRPSSWVELRRDFRCAC